MITPRGTGPQKSFDNKTRSCYMVLFSLLALCSFQSAVAAEPDIATIARSGTEALLIWDASSAVKALADSGTTGQGALPELEARAVLAAADKRGLLKRARTVTVRVFSKSAVPGAYGSTALDAATLLVSVKIMAPLLGDSRNLASELRAGKTPSGVSIEIPRASPQS